VRAVAAPQPHEMRPAPVMPVAAEPMTRETSTAGPGQPQSPHQLETATADEQPLLRPVNHE